MESGGDRRSKDYYKATCGYKFSQRFGKPLEEFSSFKIATESLRPKTIRNYKNTLPYFFLFVDEDPDTVIANRKKDIVSADATESERYERKTILYAKSLTERGLAGFAVSGYVSRIQGFFVNNGKRLSLDLHKLRVSKARKRKKYSPSNEDVRLLFSKADSALHRLIVALMYQNGPAPKDASLLTCGDYPREPWVYFERSRSKTGEVWRSISTPDVCNCLNAYLAVRGRFELSDPLFVGREGPLDSVGLSQVIHELIMKCPELRGIPGLKPTSLRDAFEDALVDAEIYQKIKEALMAHNSGIEKEYGGYNKMVSKMVEAMKKTYPLICLTEVPCPAGLEGFSAEDVAVMKDLIKRKEAIVRVFDLLDRGELVNINDSSLPARLKSMGKG